MLTDEDRPPQLRTAGEEPAFPVASGYYQGHPGISAREWFAGMAMYAILGWVEEARTAGPEAARIVAKAAYFIADAMVAESREGVPA